MWQNAILFNILSYCLFIQLFCLSLQRQIGIRSNMEVKKVTYEEALARFKHSLEVKRAAEKRIAEEWARRGLTGTIVSLWYTFPLMQLMNMLIIM